jgi:hypothetical protein
VAIRVVAPAVECAFLVRITWLAVGIRSLGLSGAVRVMVRGDSVVRGLE